MEYPNRLDQRNKAAKSDTGANGDMKPAFNMQERKDPDFVKFNPGDVLQGVLTNIERIQVRDRGETQREVFKPATRYTIEDLESGEPRCFLGTYQLDAKLRRSDIGHVIEVRHEGVDKNVQRGGNAMTRFKVFVSDATAPGWANNGTQITDADIGF